MFNEHIELLDEYIVSFKDSPRAREVMTKITEDAINWVSEEFKLRRKLGADIQFGPRYADIH